MNTVPAAPTTTWFPWIAGPKMNWPPGSPGADHKDRPVLASNAYSAERLVETNTTSFTTAGELHPASEVWYIGGTGTVYFATGWPLIVWLAIVQASWRLFQWSARRNGVVGTSPMPL